MCTRAVSGLAHYFERAGIATVVIALIPQHAQRINPPRTLAVPYALGRPLGVPDDSAFQHRVLSAALELLVRTDGPVFENYLEPAPAKKESMEGWSCPINFAGGDHELSSRQKLLEEISLLQPWYDKGLKQRGYSSVGLSGIGIDDIVGFLTQLLDNLASKNLDIDPIGGFTLADSIKHCAEDLKSFYNESAIAQPGNATALEIENWYWGETQAGQLIRKIRKAGMESQDKMVKIIANFVLVPHSQVFRDK